VAVAGVATVNRTTVVSAEAERMSVSSFFIVVDARWASVLSGTGKILFKGLSKKVEGFSPARTFTRRRRE
jgi:hypothetical protein